MAQNMLVTGQVGMIENIPLIHVPADRIPGNVRFLISHRSATVGAQQLSEYKVHDNPPGINGWLVEGRLYFDAFVLNNKAPTIFVGRAA